MVCVFPGTFYPIHEGHKFVINNAIKDGFKNIIVLISINKDKPKRNLDMIYRLVNVFLHEYIELGIVDVVINYGYTADFLYKNNLNWIIRGYRDWKDYKYEKKLYNEYLQRNPNIMMKLYKSPKELKNIRSSKLL